MANIRVDYRETVWNGYYVSGIEDCEVFIKELKEKYDNNVWNMQDDYANKGIPMHVELDEACYDFVDTDFESLEVDC